MRSKTILAKKYSHLADLGDKVEVLSEGLKIKDYLCVDREVVLGGVVFVFVSYDKWVNKTYDTKEDLIQVIVEFEPQEYLSEMIDSTNSFFQFSKGINLAERRAVEYIINNK